MPVNEKKSLSLCFFFCWFNMFYGSIVKLFIYFSPLHVISNYCKIVLKLISVSEWKPMKREFKNKKCFTYDSIDFNFMISNYVGSIKQKFLHYKILKFDLMARFTRFTKKLLHSNCWNLFSWSWCSP